MNTDQNQNLSQIPPNFLQEFYDESETIDIKRYLLSIWRFKYLIALITIIGFLFSLVFALKQRVNVYEATVSFLPLSAQQSGGSLGELSSLAGMFGIKTGGGNNSARTIKAVLESRSISEDVIEELNLLPIIFGDRYDQKKRALIPDNQPKTLLTNIKEGVKEKLAPPTAESKDIKTVYEEDYNLLLAKASKTLSKRVQIGKSRTSGTHQITASWNNNPVLAAKIANQYVYSLEKYLEENTLNSTQKSLIYLRAQFAEAKKRMQSEEQKMQKFMEKYGFPVSDHTAILSGSIGEIRKQIESEEVSLKVTQQYYGSGNSQVAFSKSKIKALKEQLIKLERGNGNNGVFKSFSVSLKDLPSITTEYLHLKRELEVHQKIYTMLRTQLESMKLQQSKDSDSVQIIDLAIPPEYPKPNKTKKLIIIGTLFSIMLSVGLAILIDLIKIRKEKMATTPQEEKEKSLR